MTSFELVLILHIATTLMMTGAIWVIQLVHYPSFLYINKSKFTQFGSFHSRQISKIVIPLMLIELATSILLIFFPTRDLHWLSVLNFLLLIATWTVTFLFSARYHKNFLNGFSELYVVKLIQTNWARTSLWTVRSLLVLYLLTNLMGARL